MELDEGRIELPIPWCEQDNPVPFTIMRDFLNFSTSENASVGAAAAATDLAQPLSIENSSLATTISCIL
jgi:hypothetical protein